jgi:hypothetical protein
MCHSCAGTNLHRQRVNGLYRRYLPLPRPYRRQLALTFAATLAQSVLGAARIWLL